MADYQVTFTLNSAYTGTTEADDFTIIGKHSGGSPSDTTIATGVTKAQLTSGVTYTVADTITGGTITSTGTCTNSVLWTGYVASTPVPTATIRPTATPGGPTSDYYRFVYCGGHISNDPTAGLTIDIARTKLVAAGMSTDPIVGDTVTISGSGNAGAVWEYQDVASADDGLTVLDFNGSLCPNPN